MNSKDPFHFGFFFLITCIADFLFPCNSRMRENLPCHPTRLLLTFPGAFRGRALQPPWDRREDDCRFGTIPCVVWARSSFRTLQFQSVNGKETCFAAVALPRF